jgi:hypothetical protein
VKEEKEGHRKEWVKKLFFNEILNEIIEVP